MLHSPVQPGSVPSSGYSPGFVSPASAGGHWLVAPLAVGNHVAVNIHVHVFTFCVDAFPIRSGIAGSSSNSMFNLWRNCETYFPKRLHRLTVTLAVYEGSRCSTSSPQTGYSWFFFFFF